MAKRAKSIEDLLAEREQFEQWLSRLDDNTDLASEKVREKVRGDYRSRLDEVMEELGSHGDSLAEQLAEHRNNQEDLTAREAAAREELAEAEVRHAVGEYDEDEWTKLKDMSGEQIDQISAELTDVSGEIESLATVQAMIAARPTAGADESVTMPEVDEGDDDGAISLATEGDESTEETPAMGAPKFTPRGAEVGGEPSAPRTLRFPGSAGDSSLDELDFLKSVTEDSSGGPSSEAAATASQESSVRSTPEVATSGNAAPEAEAETGDPTQAKTLKCGECGELNRPTEWYCERCGAELASL